MIEAKDLPLERARMNSLLEEVSKAITASAHPLLQAAVDDGASQDVIASTVVNAAMLMLVSTSISMREPDDDIVLSLGMARTIVQQLLDLDWPTVRTQYEEARAAFLNPPLQRPVM